MRKHVSTKSASEYDITWKSLQTPIPFLSAPSLKTVFVWWILLILTSCASFTTARGATPRPTNTIQPALTIMPTNISTPSPTVQPPSPTPKPTSIPRPTATPKPTHVPFTITCTNYNQDYGQQSPAITLSVTKIQVTGTDELTLTFSIYNAESDTITNWSMGSYLKHADGSTTDQGPNPDNTPISGNSAFVFPIIYDNLSTASGTTYTLYVVQVQESGEWTYDYDPVTIVL